MKKITVLKSNLGIPLQPPLISSLGMAVDTMMALGEWRELILLILHGEKCLGWGFVILELMVFGGVRISI
jgi:hypothetical protein